MQDTNRDHWLGHAQRVTRRVNIGWWLETLSAPLLITAILASCGFLFARREHPAVENWQLVAVAGGTVGLLALASWAWARRKFERPEQSLVRIEASLRMRNALSAAVNGVAPWPAPIKGANTGLIWQWPRLLVPPLGALVLLAAGLFIPIEAGGSRGPAAAEQPQAWKQLSSELDQLTLEQVVDEKYLEDTRKRLDELQAQKEEQWFSHSSLEATDSLKKSHRAETTRVERDLDRAGKALQTLEKNAGTLQQAEKNRMMEEFDQALQGLQNGAMKPNAALLEQMKKMDLKNMANLTPEQMQQLRENLKKNADAMKGAKGGAGGEDWSDELLDGEGDGEGQDGEGNGNGGVARGPGHAPGVLGAEKDALETGKLTGLDAKDLSNSSPGDLLELQDGEHEVDQTHSRISEGGGTSATGKGGDRVWKDALDPDEQRTLKRFFE